MFYFIKSRIVFITDKNSLDQRSHAQFLSSLVDTALVIAKNSILNNQPLQNSDLIYIEQALEVNGILSWHIDKLLPADQEEIDYLESLKCDDIDTVCEEEVTQEQEVICTIREKLVLT